MKILKRNKIRFIFLLSLLLAITACKTSKSTKGSAGSLAEMNSTQVFQSILDHSLQYRTLTGKLNVCLQTSKNKVASNASIRMIKDEMIQVSLQPFFGYEAFKFMITPDSIIFVSRYTKQFAAEKISDLNSRSTSIDFNFYNLQSLLTNQLFMAGKNNLAPDDHKVFSIENTRDRSMLQTKDRQSIQYLFIGDPTHKIQSLYMSTHKQGKDISLLSEYGNFQQITPGQTFPMLLNIRLNAPEEQGSKQKKGQEYEVKLNYSKIELDKTIDSDFSIPEKYQRVLLEDLLKMIKGFM